MSPRDLVSVDFLIEIFTKISPSSCENSGSDVCWDMQLFDFHNKENVGLLDKDQSKLDVFLGSLKDSPGIFAVKCRCKIGLARSRSTFLQWNKPVE